MTGQSIQQRITAILEEHRFSADECDCWCQIGEPRESRIDSGDHAAHVAGMLVEALGLTQEWAVCIEDDGEDKGVFLLGDARFSRAEFAAQDAAKEPPAFGAFVGTAWTTRWERANG